MFFDRKNGVCGRGELHTSNLDQVHFAGDEPEHQSFRFYS